ncbi:MAG: hypothetical protein IAA81_06945 [Spirochaetes bacterium]|uniref:Tetratricopeptide repeat protein n=1 Tax=Candidatus Gallitreponema excrementavium TaxID=2840840 RepID=A0A9D9HPK0_9SPIR|nr:hypothetical protein [Candidatus Gallitreponema excrementavium]
MVFTLDFKGDYVVKSVVNFFILGLLFFCTLNIHADDTDSRALEFLNRAIVSLGRGEYQDAVAYSRNCSLLSPELGDGWYGEALALIAGKQPVYEILAALEKAGSCNRWIFYNKNNCLGQYCRYLAVTTDYETVLEVSGKVSPENTTAELLLARMMAFYGLNRVQDAREVFKTSLDRFPFDTRFLQVFFDREKDTVVNSSDVGFVNLVGEALAKVDLHSGTLDFSDAKLILSSVYFLPSEEERIRVLRACSANGVSTPEGTLEMLRYGVISGETALEAFKKFSGDGISLEVFLEIPSLLKPGREISLFNEMISGYSGVILRDDNGDGYWDTRITYSKGNPYKIERDKNQDGLRDWILDCDGGTPVSIQMENNGLTGYYKKYPVLEKLEVGENTFLLKPNSLKWTPVSIKPYAFVSNILFYVPEINEFAPDLTENVLYSHSSVVQRPVSDNPGAREQMELVNGIPVASVFSENNKPYAYCSFRNGFLSSMKIDMDRDGSFEAYELYEADYSTGSSQLKTFYIDKDRDGNYEYREDYGETYRIRWDFDDDGVTDSEYNVYKDGREQTIIRHPVTGENCEIIAQNGVPLSVAFNGTVEKIIPGEVSNFFWLGFVPADNEKDIALKIQEKYNLSHTGFVSDLVKVDDREILVVKTGENYYAQIIGEQK